MVHVVVVIIVNIVQHVRQINEREKDNKNKINSIYIYIPGISLGPLIRIVIQYKMKIIDICTLRVPPSRDTHDTRPTNTHTSSALTHTYNLLY